MVSFRFVWQKYTQSGGVRPFGISTLMIGFNTDKTPQLYQTDPSGIYSEWKVGRSRLRLAMFFQFWSDENRPPTFSNQKANAIGRSSKTVREFLEKNYKEDMSKDESIKLTIKSLLEVVQTGAKNIEVAYMDSDSVLKVGFSSDKLGEFCFVPEDADGLREPHRLWTRTKSSGSSRKSRPKRKQVRRFRAILHSNLSFF